MKEFFFCPELSEQSPVVRLSREESRHAHRVLRKRTGEVIALTDGAGLLATAEITGEMAQQLECTIREISRVAPPPGRLIHLAMATVRPNRMDWAVEKCSELGTGSIFPIITHYTGIRTFKREHLRKIAISAMKQSKQAYLPLLYPPLPFNDWLTQLSVRESSQRFIAHLSDSAVSLNQLELVPQQALVIAVGPEGGFSDTEIRQAEKMGFQQIKIAGQVLRTETAAVAALAQATLKFLQ